MPTSSLDFQKLAPLWQQVRSTLQERNYFIFFKDTIGGDVDYVHLEWNEFLKTPFVSIMAPRDIGKTYFFTIGYAIWNAYYKKHKEIWLFSASERQAIKLLTRLKDVIDENPKLRWLKPQSVEKSWSKTEITLSNGVVIVAQSIDARKRGSHPGLIICDDIIDEDNSGTEMAREQIEAIFFQQIIPMLSRDEISQIIVVGTPQHYKDLLHVLLQNPKFRGRKFKSIINEKTGEVLFAKRYSFKQLLEQRAVMTSIHFAKEYQCEPVDEASTIFPMRLMKMSWDETFEAPMFYNGVGPWRTFLGADFSVPGVELGDWTVIIVLGLDAVGRVYLLSLDRMRGYGFKDQLDLLEERCRRFSCELGFLESNHFQRLYPDQMKENTNLPFKPNLVTHSGKHSLMTGVPGILLLFENMKWVMPYKQSDARGRAMTELLCEELSQMRIIHDKLDTAGEHDDCVMACWHALCAARSGITIRVGGDASGTIAKNPFFRRYGSQGRTR